MSHPIQALGSCLPALLLACFYAPAPYPQPTTAYFGVQFPSGAAEPRVATVFAASPAHRAGLAMNDLIVAIDGKQVRRPEDLEALLRKKRPGNGLVVAVRRDGAERTVRLTLAARRVIPYLGVSLLRADELQIGVVADHSPAARAGLLVSDVLVSVDGIRVNDTAELAALLRKKKPGDEVTLALRRNNEARKVRVTLGTRPGY